MTLFLLVSSIVLAQFPLSYAWNYRQQDKWPAKYCQKGISQSPIDLVTSIAKPIEYTAFIKKNWEKEYNATLTNNGFSIAATFDNEDPISLSGGGLPGTYNLDQLHFHWSSIHTIDGQRKAFEAHFALYNDKFSSKEEALEYENGLASVAILYELDEEDNERLTPIVEQVGSLVMPKKSAKISLNPSKFLPDDITQFYRYWGSLARPDCNEVVVWTIFSELCTISQAQINPFTSIQDSDGEVLTENDRDIQLLNGRNLYKGTASETS